VEEFPPAAGAARGLSDSARDSSASIPGSTISAKTLRAVALLQIRMLYFSQPRQADRMAMLYFSQPRQADRMALFRRRHLRRRRRSPVAGRRSPVATNHHIVISRCN
jgi:hypothetical protein